MCVPHGQSVSLAASSHCVPLSGITTGERVSEKGLTRERVQRADRFALPAAVAAQNWSDKQL